MKKILIIIAAGLLIMACGHKQTEFTGEEGSAKAIHDETTDQWTILGPDGKEPVTDYDSMRVVEVSTDGHPMTICYYVGNHQIWLQYYSTMTPRSKGEMVDGKREGPWVFYYPDGTIQTEATFVGGREDGAYRVYRENGVPFYFGQYKNGVRFGTWEVYDEEGNLVEKREF